MRNVNLLFAALPPKQQLALRPRLKQIWVPAGQVLYESSDVLPDVYFPNEGVVSLVATVDRSRHLEIGMVGNEGLVGIGAFLGATRTFSRAIVQAEGSVMVMSAATLKRECQRGGELRRLLERYAYSLLVQISLAAVCTHFHAAELRLARYILMMRDRLRSNELALTQQFLSFMLGVRREQVNQAAAALQQNGFVSYRRGLITLLDRKGLAAHACECYRDISHEHRAFLRALRESGRRA